MMAEEKQTSHLPIDRGWGWVIVAATAVNLFIMIGSAKSIGLLLGEIKNYFDTSTFMVTMVFAVSAVIYTLAAPVSLILGETYTQRKVIMTGAFIGFVGISLSCLAYNMEYLIVTFGICYGIGNACLYGNSLVTLGTYFSKRRSLANGLALAGASVGQFAMPPLLQFLITTYTFQGTLLIFGALYFNIVAFGALLRPISWFEPRKPSQPIITDTGEPETEKLLNNPNDVHEPHVMEIQIDDPPKKAIDTTPQVIRRLQSEELSHSRSSLNSSHSAVLRVKASEFGGGDGGLSISVVSLQNIGVPTKTETNTRSKCCQTSCAQRLRSILDFSLLKNRVVLMYVCFNIFAFFGFFNFVLFLPLMAEERNVEAYEKAYLVSIAGVCDLFGRISIGFFADFNFIQRYRLVAIAQLVLGINALVFIWAIPYWQIALHSAIFGLFGGGYVCLLAVVLVDFVGLAMMAKTLAIVLLVQGSGAAIGQVLLGWIRDTTGSYSAVLAILCACNVLGGCIILTYPLVKKWEEKRIAKQETGGEANDNPPTI